MKSIVICSEYNRREMQGANVRLPASTAGCAPHAVPDRESQVQMLLSV